MNFDLFIIRLKRLGDLGYREVGDFDLEDELEIDE